MSSLFGFNLGLGSNLGPPVVDWPPSMPGKQGGLLGSLLPLKTRDEWTIEEWREWAEWLELAGSQLASRHRVAEMRLWMIDTEAARKKARKRKLVSTPSNLRRIGGGLLQAWEPVRNKGGRPKGSQYDALAAVALQIKEEMSSSSPSRRVTDKEALEEALRQQGKGAYRAEHMRAALNMMSKLRREARRSQ